MGGCGAGEGGENEIGPIDGGMWSKRRRRERDRPYRWGDVEQEKKERMR